MGDIERFEKPLFVGVDEFGCIYLGWIHGPQRTRAQKRLSIYVDSEDHAGEGELTVYAILTGPGDRSEHVPLKTPKDVVRVITEYLNVPISTP